jgi:transcriptional regulator with XRE-family HTH domain
MALKSSTPVTDERYVGRMIRLLRRRGGLSVRWLASKSSFSPSFISQVELGHVSPSIASLDKIASALGVTISEFFTKKCTDSPLIVEASERQAVRSKWSRASAGFLDISDAEWQRVFNLAFFSAVRASRAVIAHLLVSHGESSISVQSMLGCRFRW